MNDAIVMRVASDPTPKKANAGFTLVELMVSLVLGLLLVAAAVQVLYGGVVSSRLQQGAADAQDSGLFGLDYITKDVRMANYGNLANANLILRDNTPAGGIVLTADTATTTTTTVTNLSGVLSGTAYVANGLLSHGAGDTAGTGNEWTGANKVTISGVTNPKSDQLTIQFTAPTNMSDCEGGTVSKDEQLIQRYFLRAVSSTDTALVLACDAGKISTTGALTNFGDAGQVVMQRAEHMHILLGVQQAGVAAVAAVPASGSTAAVAAVPAVPGKWRYYSINNYMALTTSPKPQIKSIKISVLVRSLDETKSPAIDPARSFPMLDQTVTPTENTKRYVRRVYTTTISLRNGMGSP